MTKLNRKYSETLALILVVALAPASIAFAQTASLNTETSTNTDVDNKKIKTETKADIRADIKAKLADKQEKRMENTKDKMRSTVTDVLSRNDQRTDLTFRGQTDGWALVNGTAFKSSITLAGTAHHVEGGNWKINSTETLTVADRTAKLDLTGHVRGKTIHLQGSGTLGSGEAIRIILNGHFAPTADNNVYAIAFTNAHIQYMNSGIRVPLMQVGSVTIVNTTIPVPAQQ